MNSDEKPKQQRSSWWHRFLWAFFPVAVSVFMWFYFPGYGSSFAESVFAAVTMGGISGALAALFGQRVVDFVLNFPW